jgi:hypothetical protein
MTRAQPYGEIQKTDTGSRDQPGASKGCVFTAALPLGHRDQVVDLRSRLGHDVIDPFEGPYQNLDVVIMDQVFEFPQLGGQCPGSKKIPETDKLVNQTADRPALPDFNRLTGTETHDETS